VPLHLENFGTYLGIDRLVYFDVNDFDEGALAPCTWDLARFVTSLILAGEAQQLPAETSRKLCNNFLDVYFATLAKGPIHRLDNDNATGLVKKLMQAVKTRERSHFLDERSRKYKTERKFRSDYAHYLPAARPEVELVREIINTLAQRENNTDFYRVHDVAFRIAGTGSLGIKRYAVLIEGHGFPNKNFILDVKEQQASALAPYGYCPQPEWENQAERVVSIQKHFQGMSPALLSAVEADTCSFTVKEYQPQQDRIDLANWAAKTSHAVELSSTLAEILAWGELRSADWLGSATRMELNSFGRQATLKDDLLDYAQIYAKKAQQDFKEFAQAYDNGQLG